VLWDESRTSCAIRVFDGGGGGGLYTIPAQFSIIGYADQLQITLALAEKDHVLKSAPEIILPFKLENNGNELFAGQLNVELNSDFGEKVISQSQP
jgi:hypothetical protein